jgi:hypothetical protein
VALSRAARLAIFRRDGFCGRETHPLYPTHTATCGHVVPMTRGSDPPSKDNLVTACARCQYYSKTDSTLEELRGWELVVPDGDARWDGVTGRYASLCALVEPARRSHDLRAWLAAVGPSS